MIEAPGLPSLLGHRNGAIFETAEKSGMLDLTAYDGGGDNSTPFLLL